MSERLRKEIIEELNDAWLNINVHKSDLIAPLDILDTEDPQEFYKKLTWLLTQPDYFPFLCKHIFKVDVLPFQGLILQELWHRKFPMLIGSRGMGKTFLMSLYCMLRALLMPERKIVVVGAAFRQSKYLHDYMESMWKNSGMLRDLCDSNSGPRRDVDMCRMLINGSQIVALPIGDGSKIRGQRANDIISDEFASMSREKMEIHYQKQGRSAQVKRNIW
jgi:phage terminase large subunit-like protein